MKGNGVIMVPYVTINRDFSKGKCAVNKRYSMENVTNMIIVSAVPTIGDIISCVRNLCKS